MLVAATLLVCADSSGEQPPKDSPINHGDVDWFVQGAIQPIRRQSNLADELEAFRVARTTTDVMPQAVVETVAALVDAAKAGEPKLEESRLLLRDSASGAELYAVPTTAGWVCYATTRGGGSCISELRDWPSWTVQRMTANMLLVHGLLPDDVSEVVVVINGRTREAAAGSNAFFLEISADRPVHVDRIRIRRRNGRTEELRVPTAFFRADRES